MTLENKSEYGSCGLSVLNVWLLAKIRSIVELYVIGIAEIKAFNCTAALIHRFILNFKMKK